MTESSITWYFFSLFLAILPATHVAMLVGCMAGGMVACLGYTVAKNAVMDVVDGGGFEAIVPVDVTSTLSVAKDTISSLNIREKVSSFADSVVTTANDGYIQVTSIVSSN